MKLLIKIHMLGAGLLLAWRKPVGPLRQIWSNRVSRWDVL